MTSDLAKLMAYIDQLQEEATPEPIVETVKPKMHPLLEAMQSLKEEGVVGSVGPDTIFNQVKDIHREFRDIEEGDLPDRIYWFDDYKTTQLPLSQINLDEFIVDEDLVEDYIDYIKDSPNTMPPIVYDPIAKSVIDGMHRANAYARLGYDTIPAYVGLTKSASYGESDTYDIEETISTGQGGGSAGAGGAQMIGGPTTYEEEYGMFKSKGPRRITAMTNEALDSSYPYEEYSMGKYHFVTDSGIKYKVYLQGKDMVEVAFSAILPGEEENFRPDKTILTGTGDSRKVFGTVVKIVKEYLDTHKPNALYFTAENAEPSRIKLYNRLIAQVDKELPDYKALGNIDLGTGTAYMLKRKQAEPVTESTETTTLDTIYHGMRPDHDEMIWNYVGDSDFDIEFPIQKINPTMLRLYLTSQYRVEDLEELFDMMDDDQEILVNHYMKEPNLSNEIIVMYDGKVIDGNHRALAAALTNKPIRYVDIGEEDESS